MMNIIAELQLLFKRRFNVKNNTKFYRLLFGHFLSRTGDAAHIIVANIVLTDITKSLNSVAFLNLIAMILTSACSPLLGVIADRIDRRKLAIFLDLTQCLFSMVLFYNLLILRNQGIFWIILILMSMIPVYWDLLFGIIIRVTVTDDYLLQSTSNLSLSNQVGTLVGAWLVGIITWFSSEAYVFLFNGVTFIVSAFLLLISKIKFSDSFPIERLKTNFWQELIFAINFLLKDPKLLIWIIIQIVFLLFISLSNASLIILIANLPETKILSYSTLEAVYAVSAIIAAILLPIIKGRVGEWGVVFSCLIISGISCIIFPFQSSLLGMSVLYSLIAFTISGWFIVATEVQKRTPIQMQGRVTSLIDLLILMGAVVVNFTVAIADKNDMTVIYIFYGGLLLVSSIFFTREIKFRTLPVSKGM